MIWPKNIPGTIQSFYNMENKISSVVGEILLNFSIVVEYLREYSNTIVYDMIGLTKTGQLIICQS